MDKLKKNKQFEKFLKDLGPITLTKKVEKVSKVQKDPNLANLKENDPKLFDYISTDKKGILFILDSVKKIDSYSGE